MSRGFLLQAAAAFLLPALLAAGPAPQAGQPTFPAGAELVVVDAVVLDAQGNPVEGLAQDDFVVREDGIVQAIARFEPIALPEAPPSGAASARFVSTNAPPRTPPRSLVIVFDDAQLSRITAERARTAVAKFLQTGLRDDDEVTLVSTATGAWWSARLGDGRGALMAVLSRLDGRRSVDTSGSRISDYEAMRLYLHRDQQIGAQVVRRFHENGVILDPANRDAAAAVQALQLGEGHPLVRVKAAEAYRNAKARNEATLRTLERVARALAEGKGRKPVVLVSDGFVYDSTLPEFKAVSRAMSQANGSVYFLDARGLPGSADFAAAEFGKLIEERDTLTTLAQAQLETEGAESVVLETGGFSVRNPNDLEGALERVARESRAYYLLGYSSPNPRRDGRFRRIEVEVRRPGLRVRARKGYYAPGQEREDRPRPAGLDPRLRQALDSPYASEGIPMRLAAYVFGPASPGKAAVLLAADADPRAFAFERSGGRFEATLDSYLVVASPGSTRNHTDEKQIALSLPPDVRARLEQTWLPIFREVELAPGVYQARFLLRDTRGGRVGTVRHHFEVPPLEALRVSTPILTDSLQGDPRSGEARPVPLARRAFAPGNSLVYLFEVHGAARDGATAAPRVTSAVEVRRADGSTMVRSEPSPIEPGPQGQLSRQIPISLQGAPGGDYEIVLRVEDQVAGRAVEVRDPFTVAGPPAPSPASGRP